MIYLFNRSQAGPNDGFKMELLQKELELFGGSSLTQNVENTVWDFYGWNSIRRSTPAYNPRDCDDGDDDDNDIVCCSIS